MRALVTCCICLLGLATNAQDTIKRLDYFETDRFHLSDTSTEKLTDFLNGIRGRQVMEIRIRSYCDDRASESYNEQLAQKRANTVAQRYQRFWADLRPEQILVEAKGELALTGEDTVQQRASNRRVESWIILEAPDQDDEFSNLKVGDKIVLKNLLFIGGRHFLLPESEPYLDSLLSKVKRYDQFKFRISGHICCQPKGVDGLDWDTQKRNLSVARAKMIYDYLVKNGIDPKRLEYVGHGSNFKLGGADKFDRRVEIEVVEKLE